MIPSVMTKMTPTLGGGRIFSFLTVDWSVQGPLRNRFRHLFARVESQLARVADMWVDGQWNSEKVQQMIKPDRSQPEFYELVRILS